MPNRFMSSLFEVIKSSRWCCLLVERSLEAFTQFTTNLEVMHACTSSDSSETTSSSIFCVILHYTIILCLGAVFVNMVFPLGILSSGTGIAVLLDCLGISQFHAGQLRKIVYLISELYVTEQLADATDT